MKKISARMWATLILIGFVGQLAWTIENMYFNVFLYNTISTDPRHISAMVGWSAAAATLTTLLMGALSDRVGKRKLFICGGYILWGASTAAFGLITVENAARLFPAVQATTAAAAMVVVLDCVMTFFGSTANDAAFNAYITDAVDSENRGKTESVLAVLPLIAMLVIFGAFDGMTQRGEWRKFFAIFGGAVTLTGLAACALMPEPKLTPHSEPYLKNLVYGLRPSVVREHAALYLAFAAFCVFSVAVQVFFPYLIIYIQNYLRLDNYAVVLGVVLIAASAVSVAAGKTIDRVGKLRFALPAALVMLLGLAGMYFARGMAAVIAAGCVMMSGYMLVTAALSGLIRDLTPEGKAGHFQGIRMIFGVLLPMILGPAIGAAVIRSSDSTYVELGVTKTVPTPAIFLAAAALLALSVPFVLALKRRMAAGEERV
jgi:MFS family permease